jgi:hypothetical protein
MQVPRPCRRRVEQPLPTEGDRLGFAALERLGEWTEAHEGPGRSEPLERGTVQERGDGRRGFPEIGRTTAGHLKSWRPKVKVESAITQYHVAIHASVPVADDRVGQDPARRLHVPSLQQDASRVERVLQGTSKAANRDDVGVARVVEPVQFRHRLIMTWPGLLVERGSRPIGFLADIRICRRARVVGVRLWAACCSRPATVPDVWRRTGLPGLSCRFGGMHVVRTARLRVAVARLGDLLVVDDLRDDVAVRMHGVSTSGVVMVDPDGTTRRLPAAEAIPRLLAAGHNPPAWHTEQMSFLARDRRTAAPIVHITVYRDPGGGYQIGGTVGAGHRAQGYGREALAAVCAIAHHHLGIARLRAGSETTNIAGQRWLASCGFTPTTGPPRHTLPDGRVIDASWWQRSSPATDFCRNRPLTDPPLHQAIEPPAATSS